MVRTRTIRFSPDRVPSMRKIRLGFEGDNLVERLEFVLPEISGSQTATLMLNGKPVDAVTLELDDDGRYAVDLTLKMIGSDGEHEAYIRIDGAAGEVWQSDVMRLITGAVPDVETNIDLEYPTAVGQMLTAMAEHSGEMQAQEERVEQAAQRAEEAAERAEAGGGGGGTSGKDGGYYQPSVTDGMLTWTPSKTDMPSVPASDVRGPAGNDGKSAYQYAQDGGYTGTEAEFAAKLAEEAYSKEETDAAISEATNEGKYELIETITIEDDTVKQVDRTAEPNGTEYKFKKVYVEVTTPQDTVNKAGVIGHGGVYAAYIPYMVGTHADGNITKCYLEADCGMLNVKSFNSSNGRYTQGVQTTNLYQYAYGGIMLDAVNAVRVFLTATDATFPIGTVIKIMGVRA